MPDDGARHDEVAITMTQVTAGARLDVWLWSVRLFPTRSAASQMCRSGRVRVNGMRSKPAARIKPGDRITYHAYQRDREVVVRTTIAKRVGAAIAVTCYEDFSPPPPPRIAPIGIRERGTGRPTKKERRRLEELRGH